MLLALLAWASPRRLPLLLSPAYLRPPFRFLATVFSTTNDYGVCELHIGSLSASVIHEFKL